MKDMKWTDKDHKGWTRWGEHPYWSQSLHHLNGVITKINDDGSFEIDFHHPMDSFLKMESHTKATVECNDWWSDDVKKSKIKRFIENAQVGQKVKVNEYHNLFYIFLWELRWTYGELKYKFIRGEPKYGYKKQYRIDVDG